VKAKAYNCGRYGWVVQWSDGTAQFVQDAGAARFCVDYPQTTHPVTGLQPEPTP